MLRICEGGTTRPQEHRTTSLQSGPGWEPGPVQRCMWARMLAAASARVEKQHCVCQKLMSSFFE
jgi:hypothetical protein